MLTMNDPESAVSVTEGLHRRGVRHPAWIHLRIGSELSSQRKHVLAAQQYTLVLQDEPSPLEQLQAHTAISLIHNQQP